MTIGELVIDLVLKGGNKSSKELKDVNKGMISVSKGALAAITAIAGVTYGFKVLYDKALGAGAGLTKFSNFTGKSAEELQKWQVAARKVGVNAEDVEGSFKGLQASIAEMAVSGMTEDFARFANAAKDFDYSKLQDTFYVMENIKDILKSGDMEGLDISQQNRIFGSMGISEGMIAGARRGIDPSKVSSADIYSKSQSEGLDRLHNRIGGVQNRIEKAFGKSLISSGSVDRLLDAVEKSIPVMTKLANNIIDLTTAIVKFYGKEFGSETGALWDSIKNGELAGYLSDDYKKAKQNSEDETYMQMARDADDLNKYLSANPMNMLNRSQILSTPNAPNVGTDVTLNQYFNAPIDRSNAKIIGTMSERGAQNGILKGLTPKATTKGP